MRRAERVMAWISALTVVAACVWLAVKWSSIPEKIPQHYNMGGAIDKMGDKSMLMLIVFVLFMMFAVSRFSIYIVKLQMKNKEESYTSRMFFCLRGLETVLVFVFSYLMVSAANCRELGFWFLPGVCILTGGLIAGMCVGKRSKTEVINEPEANGIVYKSKVDWWLGILLWGSVLSVIPFDISVLRGGRMSGFVGAVIYTATMLGLVLPILLNTKYILYHRYLNIKCSYFCNEKIPYECITELRPTHNPLSSAALSLDRIEVRWEKDGRQELCLISPLHKEEFIEEIKKRSGIS